MILIIVKFTVLLGEVRDKTIFRGVAYQTVKYGGRYVGRVTSENSGSQSCLTNTLASDGDVIPRDYSKRTDDTTMCHYLDAIDPSDATEHSFEVNSSWISERFGLSIDFASITAAFLKTTVLDNKEKSRLKQNEKHSHVFIVFLK